MKPIYGRTAYLQVLSYLMNDGGQFNAGGANTHLALYTNDYTPDAYSELGDFVEGAWSGYARVEQATAVSSPSIFPGSGPGIAWLPAQPFVSGEDPDPIVRVYGWYLLNTNGNWLLLAQRLPEPLLVFNGFVLVIEPILVLPTLLAM